jgi:hypothetical protein
MDNARVGFGREHHHWERDHVFQNTPAFLKYGEHARPLATLPGGPSPWTWHLKLYATGPRRVYVWLEKFSDDGSRDFSGHFPEYAKDNGWKKLDEKHSFSIHSAASNTTFPLEIWSKDITPHQGMATENIALRGLFRGGAVIKPCGIITHVGGGGVTWNDPVQFAFKTKPISSEVEHFVGVPIPLVNAWYYAPQRRPPQPQPHNGSWAMSIHYKPPVKIFLIVWSMSPPRLNTDDFNGGVNDAILKEGWMSEKSHEFRRSDKETSRFQVWSKVFTKGSDISIDGLRGPMVGGVAAASCGLKGICDAKSDG